MRSADGKFYFNLVAANGEVIATSEMYESKAAMNKGIQSVRKNAGGAWEVRFNRIRKWGKSKGIFDNSNIVAQAEKTKEEAMELFLAAIANDHAAYRDALADVLVTILMGAEIANVDLGKCLDDVIEILEKRTGKMMDGKFVKD